MSKQADSNKDITFFRFCRFVEVPVFSALLILLFSILFVVAHILFRYKSSQVKYIFSTFHNTDCIKAASQYESRQHNSVCLFMKRQSSLVELINGMMGRLI